MIPSRLLSNSRCMTGFYSCHKTYEKFLRVYIVLGDAVSKLETFVSILSHISRSINWSLFTLKASYLVKWPISKWSFTWWCQFIDWLKFEVHSSSLLNFGTAYASSFRSPFKKQKLSQVYREKYGVPVVKKSLRRKGNEVTRAWDGETAEQSPKPD